MDVGGAVGSDKALYGAGLRFLTKNCCVIYVKIREYANFVSNLLACLISAVSS